MARTDSGQMTIDGVPIDRGFQPRSNGPAGTMRRTGRPSKAVMELRRRERIDSGEARNDEDLD